MAMVNVGIKKACEDVVTPEYQTEGSSGMDICFFPHQNGDCIDGYNKDGSAYCLLDCNFVRKLETGLSFDIPEGYEIQIRARSGLSSRGVILANGVGTVDSDYRGEIKVPLYNTNELPFKINAGDRIAQIVIVPVTKCKLIPTDELSSTERGCGGFGHTGV